MAQKEGIKKKIRISIALLLGLLIIFAIYAYILGPDPNAMWPEGQLKAPSLKHVFGTDLFGRDVFMRTVRGFMNAFLLAIFSWSLAFGLGIPMGIFFAYVGGRADRIFYHVCNFIFSFPTLILAIYLASISKAQILILIFLTSFAMTFSHAKIVRALVKGLLEENYIVQLKLMGAGFWHISRYHLVRESVLNLLPIMPLMLGHIILSISGFSFLGYGIQAPESEIGLLLAENFKYISIAPWACLLPGLFQFLIIWWISSLGDLVRNYYSRGGLLYD